MTSPSSGAATTPGKPGDLPRFFALAYAVTWTFHGAIAFFKFDNLFESGVPLLLYMLGLLGPMTAAMVLSRRPRGAGIGVLMKPALALRFNPVLHVFAFAVIAVINYLSVAINAGLGGPAPGSWFALSPGLLPVLAVVQVWVVLGEEPGWRGFALPRLQERFGSLGASLILGVLWTLWHLPMFLMPGAPQYGASPLRFGLFLTAWSVLLTMLYNRSGRSLFAVMLFHWAANMWAFALPLPGGARTSSLALTVAAAGVAVAWLPRPLFPGGRLAVRTA